MPGVKSPGHSRTSSLDTSLLGDVSREEELEWAGDLTPGIQLFTGPATAWLEEGALLSAEGRGAATVEDGDEVFDAKDVPIRFILLFKADNSADTPWHPLLSSSLNSSHGILSLSWWSIG